MKPPIFLDWNMGIGDAVICNGLVRSLASMRQTVTIPVYPRTAASVRHMFSDLGNVLIAVHEHEGGFPVEPPDRASLRVGIRRENDIGLWGGDFAENAYRFANVPYAHRWTHFRIPPAPNPVTGAPVLVHRQSSVGAYELTGLPAEYCEITPGDAGHVLGDYVPAIEAAEEIHCVDSAILHLVESVPTRARLFFHGYARGPYYIFLRKDWKIL